MQSEEWVSFWRLAFLEHGEDGDGGEGKQGNIRWSISCSREPQATE